MCPRGFLHSELSRFFTRPNSPSESGPREKFSVAKANVLCRAVGMRSHPGRPFTGQQARRNERPKSATETVFSVFFPPVAKSS